MHQTAILKGYRFETFSAGHNHTLGKLNIHMRTSELTSWLRPGAAPLTLVPPMFEGLQKHCPQGLLWLGLSSPELRKILVKFCVHYLKKNVATQRCR